MSGYGTFTARTFGLFISPATYVVSFYFLALLGMVFVFLSKAARTDWILPIIIIGSGTYFWCTSLDPFLTMRSFAEEEGWVLWKR